MKIAAAQINVHLSDIEKNIATHIDFINKAVEEKADLVVFPELSLSGYDIKKMAPKLALKRNDPILDPLYDASNKIDIMFGMIELAFAGQIYNALLYLSKGEIKKVHHKICLPNYAGLEEAKHFSSGRYLNLFPLTEDWYAGPLICNDFWNPGLVNLAAIKGAMMFIVPINSALGAVDYDSVQGWHDVARYNAMIFGAPTIVVNRVGQDNDLTFWGGSFVYDARGEKIAEAQEHKEDLIVCDVDYQDTVYARADMPTVRDSDLDLIIRELEAVRDTVGWHPEHLKKYND